MEQEFWTTAVLDFLIALGVVLGGVILGGLGAFITDEYPMFKMMRLAEQLKIWAMVAAIGGTFDTIKNFEITILGGQLNLAFQQIVFIVSAFLGAHTGTVLVRWLIQGGF
ncbi:YtrH family sporulation protein [Thermoactinomyces mirandus]|uniref:YtrH family sporulation protein n=1 Tax=Thermoactinomyces mirandus TaxID=2756294 RepID=A0A7W1XR35_9BACL|nr:YtrH family sporulation protein [Thermoactinomyces mirandus]MBA4601590.1 YtrH family sporulation protein [Thermoactinomyces mirandus]